MGTGSAYCLSHAKEVCIQGEICVAAPNDQQTCFRRQTFDGSIFSLTVPPCSAPIARISHTHPLVAWKLLQYREIQPGTGAAPPVGFQVVVDYVAYTDKGRVFDSSLEKGKPYDIRVGAGQVIPGLDEGIRTMR